MPKPKPSKSDMSIRDDPRPKDTVAWNRLKLMVMDEACDRAWGCALYRMHRNGLIDTEQREAGDRYCHIIEDWKATQKIDPDEFEGRDREFQLNRIERAKRRREEVVEITGSARRLLDDVVLSNMYPSTEAEKRTMKLVLEVLAIFLKTGRKGARKTA